MVTLSNFLSSNDISRLINLIKLVIDNMAFVLLLKKISDTNLESFTYKETFPVMFYSVDNDNDHIIVTCQALAKRLGPCPVHPSFIANTCQVLL